MPDALALSSMDRQAQGKGTAICRRVAFARQRRTGNVRSQSGSTCAWSLRARVDGEGRAGSCGISRRGLQCLWPGRSNEGSRGMDRGAGEDRARREWPPSGLAPHDDLGGRRSCFTGCQSARLIRQENNDLVSHPFPQKTRKWVGNQGDSGLHHYRKCSSCRINKRCVRMLDLGRSTFGAFLRQGRDGVDRVSDVSNPVSKRIFRQHIFTVGMQ